MESLIFFYWLQCVLNCVRLTAYWLVYFAYCIDILWCLYLSYMCASYMFDMFVLFIMIVDLYVMLICWHIHAIIYKSVAYLLAALSYFFSIFLSMAKLGGNNVKQCPCYYNIVNHVQFQFILLKT